MIMAWTSAIRHRRIEDNKCICSSFEDEHILKIVIELTFYTVTIK